MIIKTLFSKGLSKQYNDLLDINELPLYFISIKVEEMMNHFNNDCMSTGRVLYPFVLLKKVYPIENSHYVDLAKGNENTFYS